MSPAGAHFFAFFAGFPRVSGDEPQVRTTIDAKSAVFPA